jgi:hypothetical protein
MMISAKDRVLAKVVLFWVTVVALTAALVYLIRSDHWGWRREVYFFLRVLVLIVVYNRILWAIRVRRSRVK